MRAAGVARRCKALLRADGSQEPMTPARLEEMIALVTSMASRGLRCICLSYRDYPIDDPSRPADFFEDPDQVGSKHSSSSTKQRSTRTRALFAPHSMPDDMHMRVPTPVPRKHPWPSTTPSLRPLILADLGPRADGSRTTFATVRLKDLDLPVNDL